MISEKKLTKSIIIKTDEEKEGKLLSNQLFGYI
jgi:hypothetical protein